MSILPDSRLAHTESSWTFFWVWSGTRIIITSPRSEASAGVATSRPTSSARRLEVDPHANQRRPPPHCPADSGHVRGPDSRTRVWPPSFPATDPDRHLAHRTYLSPFPRIALRYLFSRSHCHHPRPHQLHGAEGLQHPQHGIHLVLRTSDLNHHRGTGNIHYLGSEDFHNLHDLRPSLLICRDLDQDQLPLDRRGLLQVRDLDDIHQLMQLLGHLLYGLIFPVHRYGHARYLGIMCLSHGKAVNIEPAPRKQSRYSSEYTWLILN